MFYRICFAAIYIFKRFIKSQRGFSNAGAGAGYTFYPHSSNILLWTLALVCSRSEKKKIIIKKEKKATSIKIKNYNIRMLDIFCYNMP